MGLISRLFERRTNPMEDPSKPMAASALNAVFGWGFGGAPTAAGEVINEHIALQHATVYSCVRILAEAVGSLTLRTYTRSDKGRDEATQDPLWKLLALVPNDEMPASVLWENVIGCLALCGNGYLEILRNKSGDPLQLYPLHPLKTQPVRMPDESLAYRTTSGQKNTTSNAARIVNAADMLHFRLFSWDGLVGLSPIKQARQTIGWSSAAMKQSARFFGQGSKPPGILTPVGSVDEDNISNMRKAWELANGGENQNRTAVLPNDWKYTAIGISPEDSQFLQSMQFSRTDIGSIFRIPAHMIGDTTRMSNNNVEGMNLSFVIDTLRPYLVKIEQEISIKLLEANPSRFVEFDTSERLRGDYASTMSGFAVGRQWGILTANDCREQLGMNPLPGDEGNLTWAPVNMQDASRMLDTESIQDQPIDAAPAPQETKGLRSYFAKYSSGFLSLFKDAVGRITTRNKRDADSLNQILAPVLQSITELIEGEARSQFRLNAEWHASDKTQRDYIKSLCSRAAEWKTEDKDAIASAELGKAVRSLYFAIYREAGASIATRELQDGSQNDEI
jgi:HK97 family phage portal protein